MKIKKSEFTIELFIAELDDKYSNWVMDFATSEQIKGRLIKGVLNLGALKRDVAMKLLPIAGITIGMVE